MATRFYLPYHGTSPLPSLAHTSFEVESANFFRAPTTTTRSGTPITQVQGTFPDATSQWQIAGQWVSPPLAAAYSFTTSDTRTIAVRCYESNLAIDASLANKVYVVSGDGSVDRGSIFSAYSGTEWTTAAELRYLGPSALYARNALIGDRIVIELGARGLTPDFVNPWALWFGDPNDATPDFGPGDTAGENYVPWLELSPTLSFEEADTWKGITVNRELLAT